MQCCLCGIAGAFSLLYTYMNAYLAYVVVESLLCFGHTQLVYNFTHNCLEQLQFARCDHAIFGAVQILTRDIDARR